MLVVRFGSVTSLALSSNAHFLICGHLSGIICLWDVNSLDATTTTTRHHHPVTIINALKANTDSITAHHRTIRQLLFLRPNVFVSRDALVGGYFYSIDLTIDLRRIQPFDGPFDSLRLFFHLFFLLRMFFISSHSVFLILFHSILCF